MVADAGVDRASYHEFASGRFPARNFMKYGRDLWASLDKLKGLPPALVITAENDPCVTEAKPAGKLTEAGVDVTQRSPLTSLRIGRLRPEIIAQIAAALYPL